MRKTGASVPGDAQVIDLGDATLLPGLVDAQTHLTSEASGDWKKDELDWLKKPLPAQALHSAAFARRTLLADFTKVRDLASAALSGVTPHRGNAREFVLMVENGMRPVDALRSATTSAAALLGVADRLGALEPGMLADVIAVPGDPTRDIGQTLKVTLVMKKGVYLDAARGVGAVAAVCGK